MPRKPPPAGDYRYHVGDLIKTRRLARGLTQFELANLLGVALNTEKNWEQGFAQPHLEMLARIARIHRMRLSAYLSPLDQVALVERETTYREPKRRKKRAHADALH